MTRNPVLHRLPEQKERRLAVADPTWQLASAVAVAIGVGIVYFLAARFSLSLLTKPDGVAVFWPASGVAAGALIALGPRAKWPVAIGAAAATIAANLLGDRSFAGAVTFALCNAGEAMLAAGLIERQFGSGFALDRRATSLRIASGGGVRECYLGNWWNSGVQVVSLLDCADFDHLAALVRIRRARHSNGCAAADRSCRGRARPSTAERDPRRRRSTFRDNTDDHACYLSTARIICDCGADCPAVPAVALASGPLPAGIRRGGRIRRCFDDRVDDNFWHRIFRRPRPSDRTTVSWVPRRAS